MADATDLHSFAEELRIASIEALDTLPLISSGLAGAPARTFVSSGRPAFDNCCGDNTDVGGQLSVNYALVTPKQTNPVVQGTTGRIQGMVNLVQFNIWIIRCIPTASGPYAEPPAAIDIDDAATQTDADAWALWNHLYNLVVADQLLSMCQEVFFDGLRALDPSGGCGGSVLSLRAQVDGYSEVIST